MKIILFFLTFFLVFNVQSQKGTAYKFDKIYTKRLILKGNKFSGIYEVVNKSFSGTKNVESVNPEYAKLEAEVNELVLDSISETKNYGIALERYNEIAVVKSKINAFNISKKPFENKKSYLKEAQVLATKHGITDLLYADNNINKERKSRYLVLSLNTFDMKVHLNKILKKLNDSYKAPAKVVYSSVAKLKSLRQQLSETKKVDYIKKSYSVNRYVLQNMNSEVDPGDLIGDFLVLGDYNVVKTQANNYTQNQLISKSRVSRYRVQIDNLFFNSEKVLIENKETKKMYLVENGFLKTFSVKI